MKCRGARPEALRLGSKAFAASGRAPAPKKTARTFIPHVHAAFVVNSRACRDLHVARELLPIEKDCRGDGEERERNGVDAVAALRRCLLQPAPF